MQIRIKDPLLAKKIKLEAVKQDLTVPALLDKILYLKFYGHERAVPKKSK